MEEKRLKAAAYRKTEKNLGAQEALKRVIENSGALSASVNTCFIAEDYSANEYHAEITGIEKGTYDPSVDAIFHIKKIQAQGCSREQALSILFNKVLALGSQKELCTHTKDGLTILSIQ